MAHLATESIWHFAGYLHITQLLNLTPVHYSGAGLTAPAPFAPDAAKGVDFGTDPSLTRSDAVGFVTHDAAAPDQIAASFARVSVAKYTFEGTPLARLKMYETPYKGTPLPDDEFPVVVETRQTVEETEDEAQTATVTYTTGESQATDVLVTQLNFATDTDTVLGTYVSETLEDSTEGWVLPASVAQTLSTMLDDVEDALPKVAATDVGQASGSGTDGAVDREHVTSGNASELTDLDDGDGDYQITDADGTYVDGVKQAGAAPTPSEMLDTITAIVEAARERSDEAGDSASADVRHAEAGGSIPTGGTAQIHELGGNTQTNAVALIDSSDAYGSLIVRGDYHEKNVIVQINVLHDVDEVDLDSRSLVEAVAEAQNTARNTATFVDETGDTYGDVARTYYPGATDWHVDYVNGNFYDVTRVVQVNALDDSDEVETTSTNTHYVVSSGENGEVNVVQIAELSASYELVIILGDYYEYNAVVQVNVLLDDDTIRTEGASSGSQSASTDGNSATNIAAIYNYGDNSFKTMSDNAAALADALAGKSETFDYALAVSLPGDGDGTFDVLVVTGNYYDFNVAQQTNILVDADSSTADGSGGDDAIEQTATSGDNSLTNAAIIVDVGSTSDYQYLGGEYYEENLLIQANIVTDEDDAETAAGQVHEDVIATIAAQVAYGDGATTTASAGDSETATAVSSDNVLGSILS